MVNTEPPRVCYGRLFSAYMRPTPSVNNREEQHHQQSDASCTALMNAAATAKRVMYERGASVQHTITDRLVQEEEVSCHHLDQHRVVGSVDSCCPISVRLCSEPHLFFDITAPLSPRGHGNSMARPTVRQDTETRDRQHCNITP